MKERWKTKKLIVLFIFLVRITYGEESKGLLNMIEENALKKYPWMMNEHIDETVIPTDSLRRFGGTLWRQEIEDEPEKYRDWYRATQTFAFDLQFYIRTGSENIKVRVCHMIITTYLGAAKDIRRFFIARYLYLDDIDFEIGYMTHEIIAKYQNLLEFFYIARKKYFYNRKKNKAPTKYLLNKYTQMLECSTAIIHLCNMFHEIKYKYGFGQRDSKSVFKDAPIAVQAVPPGVKTGQMSYKASIGMGVQAHRDQEAKKNKNDGDSKGISTIIPTVTKAGESAALVPTTARTTTRKRKTIRTAIWVPSMTPYKVPKAKKSWWPLVYGWSIEKWY